MSQIIVPVVHLNGTSQEDLIRQISEANVALEKAIKALAQMSPNGRDYYLTGNLREAEKAHRERIGDLLRIQAEIMEIGEKIADQ